MIIMAQLTYAVNLGGSANYGGTKELTGLHNIFNLCYYRQLTHDRYLCQ